MSVTYVVYNLLNCFYIPSSFSYLVCGSLVLFGYSQSISLEYRCFLSTWGTLGTIYRCNVKNSVNITSLGEAEIDNVSEEHQPGYNNDNVVAFSINNNGQLHFFPRGLQTFFKNLKGIQIAKVGLKEIHQSDLKPFPDLVNLHMWSGNLEILEKNLFEFNPKLEFITLYDQKISYIHPNMFDKLTKLRSLDLQLNACIKLSTSNITDVHDVIRAAKAQCTNLDYLNLEQKVKILEIESKILNSRLDILEEKVRTDKIEKKIENIVEKLEKIMRALKVDN